MGSGRSHHCGRRGGGGQERRVRRERGARAHPVASRDGGRSYGAEARPRPVPAPSLYRRAADRVLISSTPLAPREPYIVMLAASFSTVIDSMSYALMPARLPFGPAATAIPFTM